MILPILALLAVAQADAPPPADPAIVAYHDCVVNGADESERRTRGAATLPAPEAVFETAEAKCQPFYAAALDAFYATTMKVDFVQAYVQGKDKDEVRAEVEAGLRSSLKEQILTNISLFRSDDPGLVHAQN